MTTREGGKAKGANPLQGAERISVTTEVTVIKSDTAWNTNTIGNHD